MLENSNNVDALSLEMINDAKKDFINQLCGGENQILEIAIAATGTSAFNKAIYYESFSQINLDQLLARNENLSFCAGLNKSIIPASSLYKVIGRKGNDIHVQQKSIVSFDLDFKDNISNYKPDKREVAKDYIVNIINTKLIGNQIRPWLVVFSGNGIHLHFKSSIPILVGSTLEYKNVYDTFRSYLECITQLKFDLACCNPSRLMRMPFSTNFKNSADPVPTQILFYNKDSDIYPMWIGIKESMFPKENLSLLQSEGSNDKSNILKNLNLTKILDYFAYAKKETIREKTGKVICSSPFSRDTNPSFFYDTQKKIYYDFSNDFGGNLFHLISKFSNFSLKEQFADILEVAKKISPIEMEKKHQSSFYVNESGVWFQDGTDAPARWLATPIFVESLTRDFNSKSWGRLLTFTDQDKIKKSWAMPMELLASDGAEIRRNLLGLGAQLAISLKDRQLFLTYLQTAKPSNRSLCVNRIGWHQNSYVLPDFVYSPQNATNNILLQSKYVETSYCLNSNLVGWQENVGKLCKGNSRLIFAISTAFASTLLKITNEESGGFHFVGTSSIGKSICLKIAASIWGNPGLNGLIKRWRSTLNGLELLANSRCDSLLLLDELGELKAQDAGLAAYLLCAGVSKNRSSKNVSLESQFEWRILFLSSGEISLSNQVERSGEQSFVGQEVRMIDLPAENENSYGIFENLHGHNSSAIFANLLSSNAEKYFGSPIHDFLTKLVNDGQLCIKIESLRNDFIQFFANNSFHGQIHRVLQRFSLVSAAGELAIEYGILPWEKGEVKNAVIQLFNEWRNNWASEGSKEFHNLLCQIKSILQEYGPSRFPLINECKSNPLQHNQKLWGVRIESEDGHEWAILSEVFRIHLCKGYDSKKALKQLKDAGLLLKGSTPMRVPHIGLARVITLSKEIIL